MYAVDRCIDWQVLSFMATCDAIIELLKGNDPLKIELVAYQVQFANIW